MTSLLGLMRDWAVATESPHGLPPVVASAPHKWPTALDPVAEASCTPDSAAATAGLSEATDATQWWTIRKRFSSAKAAQASAYTLSHIGMGRAAAGTFAGTAIAALVVYLQAKGLLRRWQCFAVVAKWQRVKEQRVAPASCEPAALDEKVPQKRQFRLASAA
ncbi:hypothetical protein MRX96_013324 [Rhipicephalus microplus]